MDEAKLLRKVCRGESKALERLIEQYTAYVTTIVYHIIGSNMSREDVEEVVSDVFVALWQQAEEVHKGKLKGFLSRIARCKAINKLREKSIAVTVEDDELELVREENFPEEIYLEKEKRSVVQKALLSMEQPDREIFLRYYYYYQTVAEVAEDMKLTLSAVKSRLSRGRQKLKKTLQEGGYFYEDNRMDGEYFG